MAGPAASARLVKATGVRSAGAMTFERSASGSPTARTIRSTRRAGLRPMRPSCAHFSTSSGARSKFAEYRELSRGDYRTGVDAVAAVLARAVSASVRGMRQLRELHRSQPQPRDQSLSAAPLDDAVPVSVLGNTA